MHSQGLDCDEINETLNKKSGLLGVSGQSNDMRDLLAAAADGNEKAELAVEMFVYRVAKYIGSYRSILPDLDAVVLTGGIGENSRGVRRRLMETLSPLGAVLDEQANTSTIRGKAGAISTPESALPVWVIGTNEELMIARETKRLVTTCRA
jgi:acetate kinase